MYEYFTFSVSGRHWPEYVKFNALGNLAGANFKTLVSVGFKFFLMQIEKL